MAEFQEVMRQGKRICESCHECEPCPIHKATIACPVVCYEDDCSLAEVERIIMDWAAEHPEPRYPTWNEWQKANFPDAQEELYPCNFARCPKNPSECFVCDLYRESAIPADIAQKLGIEPIK